MTRRLCESGCGCSGLVAGWLDDVFLLFGFIQCHWEVWYLVKIPTDSYVAAPFFVRTQSTHQSSSKHSYERRIHWCIVPCCINTVFGWLLCNSCWDIAETLVLHARITFIRFATYSTTQQSFFLLSLGRIFGNSSSLDHSVQDPSYIFVFSSVIFRPNSFNAKYPWQTELWSITKRYRSITKI